jgi:hypothetical protein
MRAWLLIMLSVAVVISIVAALPVAALNGSLDVTWTDYNTPIGDAKRFTSKIGMSLAKISVLGRAKEEIQAKLGPPKIEDGLIDFFSKWPQAKEADSNWLYESGNGEVLLICFKNNHCLSASIYEDIVACEYENLKAEKIGQFALGRSISEIKRKFGGPTSVTGPMKTSDASGEPKEFYESDSMLCYYTGPSAGERLSIKNGICTAAEGFNVFH